MQDKSMTLTEHLEDLRRVIIISALALIVATALTYFGFRVQLMAILTRPMQEMGYDLIFITPLEAFLTSIKACFLAAVFLTFPIITWQVWGFILPALNRHERKYLYLFTPFSVILFVLGLAFSYYAVFPLAIRFLLVVASDGFQPMITVSRYISFVTTFILPFGIVFQLPLLIMLLTRLGLITPPFLVRQRKIAILAIFIVAAILTPPDVISQLLMGLPMVVLYEASIWLSYLVRRRSQEQPTGEGKV
jgi:sec-independent protein translocase protein TatC